MSGSRVLLEMLPNLDSVGFRLCYKLARGTELAEIVLSRLLLLAEAVLNLGHRRVVGTVLPPLLRRQ